MQGGQQQHHHGGGGSILGQHAGSEAPGAEILKVGLGIVKSGIQSGAEYNMHA